MFDIIPSTFAALALAHFLALMSPGQDFFLISGHAIRHGFIGSRFICVGVALGNGVYILVAALGWNSIRTMPQVFTVVEVLGAGYLLWVGWHLLKSKALSSFEMDKNPVLPSAIKQLLLGLNSALLNPKNALFYMSLMTVLLGSEVTVSQQVFCSVWMFLIVLVWDLVLALCVGMKHVRHSFHTKIHYFERMSGLVLISFGLGLFANIRL